MTVIVRALGALPDLDAGADLVALLLAGWSAEPHDGDVLTISSKAVAKVEGRTRAGPRDDVVDDETDRDVARHGGLRIVRTRHGLVLAAAGVDESNTTPGTVVPLPLDADASARRLRAELETRTGRNVAVVVTDTAGRAWRTGQTDIAVGVAGLEPLQDLAGQPDGWGRPLAVTAPAVADEVAGMSELVLGKAARTPAAVVSGLAALVLPAGEHGAGAAALIRPETEDLFGLGATDAVTAAVRRRAGDRRGFAAPGAEPAAVLEHLVPAASAGHAELSVLLDSWSGTVVIHPAAPREATEPAVLLGAGAVVERLCALGWAAGLQTTPATAPAGAVCAVVLAAPSVH